MNSLDALASSYGIQAASLDAKGPDVVTTPGVKLAMLAAMGVNAKDEEAALAALKALEDSQWDRPTPPVVVAYAEVKPIRVPVVTAAGTKVLHWFFERNEDGFARSARYPYLSLSVASSHDLPTLAGWWMGRDLDSKAALNLFPTQELDDEAREKRRADRRDLVAALQSEHLLDSSQTDGETFSQAAQAFLGKTNSMITLIQLDDLTGEVEQVNIPATTERANPNWRRKQSVALEDLAERSQLTKIATTMRNTRSERKSLTNGGAR